MKQNQKILRQIQNIESKYRKNSEKVQEIEKRIKIFGSKMSAKKVELDQLKIKTALIAIK